MRSLLAALLVLSSCRTNTQVAHPTEPIPDVLRDLPPRVDPAIDLSDDADLKRARDAFDAMLLADPQRAQLRRDLWAAYQTRAETQLAADSRETAFQVFARGVDLWDPRELDDEKTAAPDIAMAEPLAQKIYKEFAATGSDVEAVLALAVLIEAHPERAVELGKSWDEIARYDDDLALATQGPGAERSRTIEVLETVILAFPSRWVGETVVRLYLERQQAVVNEIRSAGGGAPSILGAQNDPGVMRPMWNIARTYARLRRLPDALPHLDKLAGQHGEETNLHQALREALGKGATGESWVKLAGQILGGARGDVVAALHICEAGSDALPSAIEPRICVAGIAHDMQKWRLAQRYAEEARKLAPGDRKAAEILVRLYVIQIGDNLQAERIKQARELLAKAEAILDDADKRWPVAKGPAPGNRAVSKNEPFDIGRPELYVTMGRGLYNLGEIDEALRFLQLAEKAKPTEDLVEQMALIAMKQGRFADAAAGFEQAAGMPRPTPLAQKFEGSRLRRLAAEAQARAGQEKKAQDTMTRLVREWSEILASRQLREQARALAHNELARLRYALGQTDEALRSFENAVNEDPDEPGTYADIVAFLFTRGHRDEAVDTYHRLLFRPQADPYFKVYTSLWIVDLARLRGEEPDPLALEYLAKTSKLGNRWFFDLARFKTGQLTFEQLLERADTRGKRAEAFFYEAMNRYAKGDRANAETLLKGVIKSNMMGFFEFDMALHFLRNGPPSK
jgi:tetratricopeptide (TPR) repeat protein